MALSENWGHRAALMVAHCAGMVDLVALPVWIGTLVAHYRFDSQEAGALATFFLVCAVLASAFIARRFDRIRGRFVASCAFGLAALAFAACSRMHAFGWLAVLHCMGGFAAGTALSITHGTVGLSANPHRLFGILGAALGIFAVLFLAVTPQVITRLGGSTLFVVIGGVMGVACIVTACFFPDRQTRMVEEDDLHREPLPRRAWLSILGICCMALTQAMVFSFLERMGADRGFDAAAVNLLLIALGLINLAPGLLAALLQGRLDARKVLVTGAALQSILAVVLAWSSTFAPYAAAGAVFVAVMIFTHTFCFGLLAKQDPSGRAVAATPAMLMVGSAVGPILGGTLVKAYGYGALGVAALVIDFTALAAFSMLMLAGSGSRVRPGIPVDRPV